MSCIRHASFEGVKGYATYDRAVKRGQEVVTHLGLDLEVRLRKSSLSWFVVALPNGRFAPCFTGRDINPGWFISLPNICMVN